MGAIRSARAKFDSHQVGYSAPLAVPHPKGGFHRGHRPCSDGGHHDVNYHSDPSTFIPGEIKMNNDFMDSFPAQGRASLAKNFSDGKYPELEGITGTLARLGRETGTPTPVNGAL